MGCLRKGLIVVSIILFVVLLPAALLTFNSGRVLFNQALMTRITNDVLVDSDVLPAALAAFSAQRASERATDPLVRADPDQPDIIELLALLDFENWKSIRDELLTEEIVSGMITDIFEGFYAWIDSDDPVPAIYVDMTAFKARVNSEHGTAALDLVYSTLAPCNQAQLNDFEGRLSAAAVGDEVPYNLCKFPDPYTPDQYTDYGASLREVVDNIPDQFEITQGMRGLRTALERAPAGPRPKTTLRVLRATAYVGLLAPGVILLVLALLAGGTLRSFGFNVGAALSIGGLFSLIASLISRAPVVLIQSLYFRNTPTVAAEELSQGLAILAQYIFQPMLIQAALILLAGLIVIGLGVIGASNPDALRGLAGAEDDTDDEDEAEFEGLVGGE